jgi:hypothetical protein
MHGDFLGEKTDGKLVGGIALLSGYINKVRQMEKNVIYAIAGDMFRGSVIDSEYKGISTVEIMNLLAPDVVTIGNHEADYGLGHLLFIEKCAKFPIINANMYIRTTGTRLFQPYAIIKKDGMRILFIGAVTEDVLSQTKTEDLDSSGKIAVLPRQFRCSITNEKMKAPVYSWNTRRYYEKDALIQYIHTYTALGTLPPCPVTGINFKENDLDLEIEPHMKRLIDEWNRENI